MNLLKKFLAFTAIFTMTLSVSAFAVVEKTEAFYVADYADVIENDTEQYIIKSGKALYDATGAQIVVVTVDFLDGMDIEDYAYELFNDWAIGDKDKNNGLLLLLTIGEQNYWAMVGDGIRYDLDAGTLDDILYYNLEPDFAVGDYDSGVRNVYDKFYEWFEDFYNVNLNQSDKDYTYQNTTKKTYQNTTQGYNTPEPDYNGYDDGYREPVSQRDIIITMIKVIFVLAIILYIVVKFAKKVEKATGQNYYDGNTNNTFFINNSYRPPMGGWNPPPPPPPRPPRPPRPPKPPRSSGGGFGGFGGSSGGGFGGFGGGFGGGGFSSGGGAGRSNSGGGGSSHGGGAGRR